LWVLRLIRRDTFRQFLQRGAAASAGARVADAAWAGRRIGSPPAAFPGGGRLKRLFAQRSEKTMRREKMGIAMAAGVIASGAAAWAQGPMIQVAVENSRIVTRGLIMTDVNNYTEAAPNQTVYQIPMVYLSSASNLNDLGWYAEPSHAA